MDIQIFVCDTAEALVETVTSLQGHADILYQTPNANAETGRAISYRVKPPRGAMEELKSFTNRYIVVARRP